MVVTGDILHGSDGKDWKIEEQLGSGTCCTVYKAHLTKDGSQAAVKVYKPEPRFDAACEREALLLDILQRYYKGPVKYTATVLDSFCHEDHQCMVQELLDCDIRQIVQKNSGQGLSLYLMQLLAKDFLCGVDALHKVGFIHGDLKPSNLMWSPQDGCLKVIDFSLSFHQDDQDIWYLQSNGYRSPEVNTWNASKAQAGATTVNITSSADMWSVGCILVEMFTGSKLFPRTEHHTNRHRNVKGSVMKTTVEKVDLLIQVREQDKTIPSANQVVTDLRQLIHSMLAHESSDRITAEKSLQHAFFQHSFEGSFKDTLLLQTCVLRLMNMMDESELKCEELYKDILEDIEMECRKFGTVSKCIAPQQGGGKSKVYVSYADSSECHSAVTKLCGRSFNNRTVITSYFLPRDLLADRLW